MELTERYLQAVRFWLPRDQSNDIVAELAEDLKSQMEEKQAQLGRELREEELVELLRRGGDPMQVAQRYLPQRYLIGPALFPLYWFVLRGALYIWAIPWLLVWFGYLIFSPAYRVANPGLVQVHNLAELWISLVYWAFMVTVGFAVLERRGGLARLGWRWDPRRLPATAAAERICRADSIAGLMWNGIVALWWAGLLKLPALPNMQIGPSPVVLYFFYWPILIILLALVVIAAINAVRPVWTRGRAASRLAIDACALALIGALLIVSEGRLTTITGPNLSAGAIQQGAHWINVACSAILAVVAVVFVADVMRTARLYRSR